MILNKQKILGLTHKKIFIHSTNRKQNNKINSTMVHLTQEVNHNRMFARKFRP